MRLLSLVRSGPVPTPYSVGTALLLTRAAAIGVPGDAADDRNCLAVLPLDGPLPAGAGQGSHGAALVPAALDRAVVLNGSQLAAGLHLLRHRDSISVGGQHFHVALHAVVEETDYDPGRHGEDIFCARTRRRITAGERVVACPGTAERICELIFSATAWRAGVRCHQCGFDPNEKPWRPGVQPETRSVRELLARIRGRRRG